jgi:predicted  nucleic acid-binding Zn-ribbon protein
MAGNEQQFIRDFNASLARLGEINNAIEINTRLKTDFNTFVLRRVSALRDRINDILNQIRAIRGQLDNLQGNVRQNGDDIRMREERIQELTRQLAEITAERDNLRGELDAANRNNADLQQRFDQLEQANVALINERDALQRELANGGDLQQQHAQAIQELQDEHWRQLNAQQGEHVREMEEKEAEIAERNVQLQANADRIAELERQIADREAQLQANAQRIQELEQQLADVNNQLQANAQRIQELEQQEQVNVQRIQELEQQLADANNQLQGNANLQQQIEDLRQQIQVLEEQNRSYIEKIVQATNAINNATANLARLTDEDFYNNNRNQINDIVLEIEGSLQQITNVLAGNLANNPAQPANNPPQPHNNPPGIGRGPNRRFFIGQGNARLSYDDLLNNLQQRALDVVRSEGMDNKYARSYRDVTRGLVREPNMNEQALGGLILKSFRDNGNIQLNPDGTLRGGRYIKKTKKNRKYKKHKKPQTRKQKGGFLYGKYKKTNTNTTSSKSATGTSSTSPLTTSTKNKKINTKKQKINIAKGRGLTKNRTR